MIYNPTIYKILLASTAMLLSILLVDNDVSQNCKPQFEEITAGRYLPHAYYDQGMSSLPGLYPDHVMIASRRNSKIDDIRYALFVYKEKPEMDSVRIEGVAVDYPKAWRFNSVCPEDSTVSGVITLLEEIANLPESSSEE